MCRNDQSANEFYLAVLSEFIQQKVYIMFWEESNETPIELKIIDVNKETGGIVAEESPEHCNLLDIHSFHVSCVKRIIRSNEKKYTTP